MHWMGKRDTGQDASKRDGRLRRAPPGHMVVLELGGVAYVRELHIVISLV